MNPKIYLSSENFEKLIAFLAEMGYVKKDTKTINTLKYKLSGIPSLPMQPGKIEWKEEGERKTSIISSGLYCLAKLLAANSSSHANYKDLEKHFEFKPATNNPSAYANSVMSNFKLKFQKRKRFPSVDIF